MQIINGDIVEIIADEGKILYNGEVYAHHLWLGIYDSPSNWQEINEEEVPLDERSTEDNLFN